MGLGKMRRFFENVSAGPIEKTYPFVLLYTPLAVLRRLPSGARLIVERR